MDKAKMLKELLQNAREDLDKASASLEMVLCTPLVEAPPKPTGRAPSIFDEEGTDEDNDEL